MAFSSYEVSRDHGITWQFVATGMPRLGEWVRRPLPQIPLIDPRCMTAVLPEQLVGLHCFDP